MLRQIRKQRLTKKKTNSRRRLHKGGALYSWDFNDKIGGLPAQRALWKTEDSDCPPEGANSKTFGFDLYGVKVQQGGRRTHSKKPWGKKNSKKSSLRNLRNNKTKKNHRKH